MAYDLHGPWDSVTGENTPLYAGPSDRTAYQRNLNAVSTSVQLMFTSFQIFSQQNQVHDV
jgi:GH18 family chitinase